MSPIKVAIQSLLWGVNPPVISDVVKEAKEAGYDGIEMAIDPERLADSREEFVELLLKHELALVGISRGSFQDKVNFVRWFKEKLQKVFIGMAAQDPARKLIEPRPDFPYIYIDEKADVEKYLEGTAKDGTKDDYPDLTFALHPHMYKSIQTFAEASALLERHPRLRFLPDTAHCTIAGDDPSEIVSKYFDRLIAVHVKDWRAEFGRSLHFYARGFVDIGEGDVPIKKVIRTLQKQKYDRWIVFEKDISHQSRPFNDAKANLNKLRQILSNG